MDLRPFFSFQGKKRKPKRNVLTFNVFQMEPMIGIEPMTYSLRVNCSTD